MLGSSHGKSRHRCKPKLLTIRWEIFSVVGQNFLLPTEILMRSNIVLSPQIAIRHTRRLAIFFINYIAIFRVKC